MQPTETSKMPKIEHWKYKNYNKRLDKEDKLFTEVLVQDNDSLIQDNKEKSSNINNYRRSYTTILNKGLDDTMSSSSFSYTTTSASSDEEEEKSTSCDSIRKAPPPPPHRISPEQIKVKRIQRSMLQKLMLTVRTLTSIVLSAPMLLFFVTIATYRTAKTQLLDTYYYKKNRPQDGQEKPKPDELLTQDETYYADLWGYTSEMHQVLTEDGYILKMYRIFKKGTNPQGKRPVLIGHGLFQCSGAFVLNEERSLAFTLIDQDYDVWVGNNRATGGLDHTSLSHKDPEYWNWGLKELGIYDFPSMVDHVRLYSGFKKIAYIGHSQGNAQAFIGLSLKPELSDRMSCFVALAPAVFAGNLVNVFPISLLINLNDWMYSLMFGTASFLPVMSTAQLYVEPYLFCFLAYSMFSYLFTWWDSHWLRRRKAKYFQYTPRPVSSKLIADWIAGWGRKGVCLYVGDENIHHNNNQKKPTSKVPLVVFYGTADFLTSGERLVRTFKGYETHGLSPTQLAKESSNHEYNTTSSNTTTLFPMLDLVHVERIEDYEHMDTIWGHDNHLTTYPVLLSNLRSAKWDE